MFYERDRENKTFIDWLKMYYYNLLFIQSSTEMQWNGMEWNETYLIQIDIKDIALVPTPAQL